MTMLFHGAIYYLLLTTFAVAAPSKETRNELPAPYHVQRTVLKNAITLSWQWPKPEELPAFKQFGYDVKRQGGKTFFVSETTFSDANLSPGSYAYQVRARGVAIEKRKTITYVSDWSESIQGTIQASCPEPPVISITVEPTQKAYASVTTLRFHIKGQARIEGGCTLSPVSYHLDSGTGIIHTGPLKADTKGQFDAYINAFGPENEIPSGHVSFSITASASTEAGPATSPAVTVDVELQDPFAPRRL